MACFIDANVVYCKKVLEVTEMVQLGFSLQADYGCPQEQVIELLQDAGFSAISPVWSEELALDTLVSYAAQRNMTIQSLHAPRGGLAYLWNSKDPLSSDYQKRITDCIDACAEFSVPIMVMHGWQGLNYTFPETPLDFTVFDRITDYAGEKNVAIAFENLEGEEYLNALMDRYRDRSYVGFCWDTGHDHCYPHTMDFLKSFGDRLIMTHIHDNMGVRDPNGVYASTDDLHYMPYDGTIHWESAIGRLKGLPKQNILNFELKKVSKSTADRIYENLSIEDYFQLAGHRARKIADLYEKITKA